MFGKKKITVLEKELNRIRTDLKESREMALDLIENKKKQLNMYLEEKQELKTYYESAISKLINSHNDKENNLLAKLQKKDDEIKHLKIELEKAPKLLSQINLDNLRNEMGKNAWDGKESRVMFVDTDGNPVLKLNGHMYEPSYECFKFTCMVAGYDSYGKEFILFDENERCIESYRNETVVSGSEESIRNYIKEKDRYVLKK
ncbi:hypothetical protein DW886_14900 [Enterocloster aldenensis]|uniref:hypothetical protein n=1 Tax=Enterocloster aldenensis TaxID=358742 RepID=UPI000E4E23C6|nr:hypothetical protein DW886_14900 [Enterocloster aldenensis]